MHHVYLSNYPNITFRGGRRLGGFTLKVHHFFADHYAKSERVPPACLKEHSGGVSVAL